MCLPLANMCLCAWMEMMVNDPELWADSSSLHFDTWLAKEMIKSREDGHREKTSYERMMAIFGRNSGEEDGTTKLCDVQAGIIPEDPSFPEDTTPIKTKVGTPLQLRSLV